MELPLDTYLVRDADRITTPALLIFPELVDANIRATLGLVGGDPNRWRPHIKTAKLGAIIRRMVGHGIRAFKCATTLELLTACEAGANDVLLAFAVVGANANRTLDIVQQFPRVRISVLIETAAQASFWTGKSVGLFIDVNPGMDRTGIDQARTADIATLARSLGHQFRGLHYYDGHVASFPATEREKRTHEGYDQLMRVFRTLEANGIETREVITSGTPAAPYGYAYAGFQKNGFVHRISPGTVVYNDTTSLEQLSGFGYVAAVAVLSTVISHPTATRITCDAGHKSVSADAGVPTCAVVGRSDLKPLKPSEEHLPIESLSGQNIPEIGENLYLIPRHVCPTVNNFDQALMIVKGRVTGVESVSARGHENLVEVAVETPTAVPRSR